MRVGNLVKANASTPLVVINQIHPILVRFAVPQAQLPDIQRYFGNGKSLLVTAAPSEGSAPPQPGTLTFVDNNVDSTTGTVTLKGTFANNSGALWPGQFVSTALRLFVDPSALVVPVAAIQTGQQGTYVFTLDGSGGAKQTPVTVDRTVDTLAVISKGLTLGEPVITDGQSRIVPGAKIVVRKPGARGTGASGAGGAGVGTPGTNQGSGAAGSTPGSSSGSSSGSGNAGTSGGNSGGSPGGGQASGGGSTR